MEDPSPSHRFVKLGGYTRDRRGCLTCRRRKKKCTLESQRCRQCVRLNLECVWDDERRVVAQKGSPGSDECTNLGLLAPAYLAPAAGSPVEYSSPSTGFTLMQPSHGLLNNDGDASRPVATHRRMAMRYYIQDFAGILSTTGDNNGFLSVLLPMAMDSKPLMDSLVAYSTSHLALRQDTMTVKALEDRVTALRSFARYLKELTSEDVLAICLILTSMEAILGSTADWHYHLSAAANVIRSTLTESTPGVLTSSLERSSEGRWLLRNFAYHDILASISLDRDLLIPNLDWQGQPDDDLVDTYLGLASAPMALLGQVSALSQDIANAMKEASPFITTIMDEMGQRLLEIEEQLLQWLPTNDRDQSLAAMAESYRCASLIHLYRVVRRYGLQPTIEVQPKIAHQVDIVMQCMRQMPVGCLPECTLLFPMFIAGGETNNADYQDVIAARMKVVAQERHFTNVSAALDVLQEVWNVRSQTIPIDASQPFDWQSVLKRRKWNLALT